VSKGTPLSSTSYDLIFIFISISTSLSSVWIICSASYSAVVSCSAPSVTGSRLEIWYWGLSVIYISTSWLSLVIVNRSVPSAFSTTAPFTLAPFWNLSSIYPTRSGWSPASVPASVVMSPSFWSFVSLLNVGVLRPSAIEFVPSAVLLTSSVVDTSATVTTGASVNGVTVKLIVAPAVSPSVSTTVYVNPFVAPL